MIPALIAGGWLVLLAGALSLTWAAKRADDAIEAHRAEDPFEAVDAIVFEFPKQRSGGGFVA